MKKKLTLLLAVLLLVSLLCGCGSSAENSIPSSDSAQSAPAADYNSSAGWAEDEWSGEVMDFAPAPEPEYAPNTSGKGELLSTPSNSIPENAKLIYTADIGLQTTEFDTAVQKLGELVDSMGGYFENSSVNNYSSYRSGNYTVRVPAKNFDAFCTQAGQLCQLNYISRSAEDVSEYYYDTESRLATQQTKLDRLQELLSKAESMEDIIVIESAISETELAIEQLTGTLRHYDSLVGYSTVSISLDEVYRLDDIEQPAIGFGAKLAAALKNGCSSFVRGLQGFLLGVASNWVGWLIFLVIVGAAVFLLVRRIKRRRKNRGSGDGWGSGKEK